MTPQQQYLEFCERNFGRPVDDIRVWKSSNPQLPDVAALIWRDHPEIGTLTAVSYGLSLMEKDEWVKGKPELMIRLDTDSLNWPLAMAYFIDAFREEKSFRYLTILTMDEKISDESGMQGFFTFGPPVIEGESSTFVRENELPINLIGFYPIYLGERELLPQVGLDAFWNHPDYDMFSVTRLDMSQHADFAR